MTPHDIVIAMAGTGVGTIVGYLLAGYVQWKAGR